MTIRGLANSRRAAALAVVFTTACAASEAPAKPSAVGIGAGVAAVSEEHPFFSTVSVDYIDSVTLDSTGDLWPSCWSDDDNVYAANGDGTAFGVTFSDVLVSRIQGRPSDASDPLRGTTLAFGDQLGPLFSDPTGLRYNRKPTGMLCANGELYLALQDLETLTLSEVRATTIVRSSDKGRTWSWDKRAPMFDERVFTTIMFLDFGKNSEHARDGYAYAYGLDDNWSAVYSSREPQTKLYLARVPFESIQDRSRWEFFSGRDSTGEPTWDGDISRRAGVLEDRTRSYVVPLDPNLQRQNMTSLSQGSVIYDAPLQRYIYSTWTMYTFELYEAPEPWGPWTHFYTLDFGVFPWTDQVAGGYATVIPTKYISADGQTLYMHSNVWEAGVLHYQYSLRKLQLTAYKPSEPSNSPGPESLATAERGAVAFVRAARGGHVDYLNDGKSTAQSETSWTGERKTEDYWGYSWPHALHVNRVRYTTGARQQAGGFFSDLTVQVRRGNDWVDVTGLQVSPVYTHDSAVLGQKLFTFSFDETVTDGVRIHGTPGGSDTFTNIAELSVHYE